MNVFELATIYAILASDEGPPFGCADLSTTAWADLAPQLAGALVHWN